MSLEMILGASGHGKTTMLYERLVAEATEHPEKRFVLIVPEQSSLQAQKEIVRLHRNHGVFNIDVLTFGRLGYRIFEELGIELPETIDETGKNLLIRKVMDEVNDRLRLIHPSRRQGFITDVKSMLSELKQYGITAEELKQIAASMKGNDRLKEKLADLAVVYEAFEAQLKDRYITAEDKPELLLSVIERSDFLRGTVVALDGFTGFTPVQYRLLSHMLGVCEEVRITVTLPEDVQANVMEGEEELFHMSKQMIEKCGRLADELKLPARIIRVKTEPEKTRFHAAGELDFLERNLFRYNGRVYEGENHAVQIRHFPYESDEVSYVAADLMRKVREEGLRFRDIAVITGDTAGYGKEVTRIFDEAGIPYFLDEKRSILGNPLVELIRGAIAVVYRDASYESMFYVLKNVLCPVTAEEADILENYVLAMGTRGFANYGEAFVRPYAKARPGDKDPEMRSGVYRLGEVNRIRIKAVELFSELREGLTAKEQTVRGYVEAVYAFLEKLDAYSQMLLLAEEIEARGDSHSLTDAAEYRTIYGQVIGLLDRLVAILGEESLSLKEFSDILDAGFDEIRVGILPPSADCVTVGDLKRSRLEHIKVLYVLGVNEGLIPKSESNRGILSEQEREILGEHQVELAPTVRQKIYEQNFYLYLNLTKPERELILTYHRNDAGGEKQKPSRLVHMLKNMYGDAVEQEGDLSVFGQLSGEGNALHLVMEPDRDAVSEGYFELLSYLWSRPESRERMEAMLSAYRKDTEEDTLTRAAAELLYRELENSNVSRVETYAGCAFAHFIEYGLGLEERKQYRLEKTDLGVIFHQVLEKLGGRLKEAGRSYADLTDEERPELVRLCLEESTMDYGNSIFMNSETNAFMKERILQILDRTVWALGEQLKAGNFVPAAFEKKFSLDIGDETFRGTIDRVDLYETKDEIQVKIIDYKSSRKEISFEDVYAGLQLQLLVYLKDVLEKLEEEEAEKNEAGKNEAEKNEAGKNKAKKVTAAAVLYNAIVDPYVNKDEMSAELTEEEAILEAMKPSGLLNVQCAENLDRSLAEAGTKSHVVEASSKKDGLIPIRGKVQTEEHLRILANFASSRMASMTKEIREGHIEVNPYQDSCKYCKYEALCGLKRPGHDIRFRNKLKVKEEEIFGQMKKETE